MHEENKFIAPFAFMLKKAMEDPYFMEQALLLAQEACSQGEVPVGALVVEENKILAQAYNQREQKQNPLLHAEILAIHKAAKKRQQWRLNGCTLYVTLEPCAMCAGAIVQSRLSRLVYGACDPKGGAISSLYQICSDPRLNHQTQVSGGVLEERCSQILTHFFQSRRKKEERKENEYR